MAPVVIAVAGKGGTGKTTVCGMIIDRLAKREEGHILAVDADPNSNLNEVLGVRVETTLGDIRETMVGRELTGEPIPAGMTKQEYAEFMFSDALSEGDRYDLLVMGRTQGTGCYCYVNGVLKSQIDRYAGAYGYIVVDNEAGLEHISRGTLPHIDVLLLVSDCSKRGVQAVARIAEMVDELKLKPGVMKLIVNRAPGGVLDGGVAEEISEHGLELAAVLPQDETVYRYDCDGRPTAGVPEDNPVKLALSGVMDILDGFVRERERAG
jgi:CO dehydrogenase maturation factor